MGKERVGVDLRALDDRAAMSREGGGEGRACGPGTRI